MRSLRRLNALGVNRTDIWMAAMFELHLHLLLKCRIFAAKSGDYSLNSSSDHVWLISSLTEVQTRVWNGFY